MGVYRRPDSKYWWLWLEGAATPRQATKFLIGSTAEERKDSRASAQAAYHKAMLDLGRTGHGLPIEKDAITFKEFADWYDQHVLAHHRGVLRDREILKTIRATFDSRALASITTADVLEWRSLRAEKTSASTSNRELALFKHLMNAAVPKYLDASPIARMKLLRPVRRETRVLSVKEEARLLAQLEPEDQALIICALDTLMRLSDVVNLRREQDRGTYLVVVDPKVQPYRVPVSKRLRAALDALPSDGPYYFAHRRKAEKARDYRGNIQKMLKRACKRARIPYGRKKGGLTFHGLRHTATTRLVEAGVPLRIVQELGGWKSMRQLDRYAHPTEQAKRSAVEQIGSRVTHDATPNTRKQARKPRSA